MATFRQRVVTRREIWLILAASAAPIFSWAIVLFFEQLSGWLYYLNLWEIASIFAYTQLFALVESLLLVAGLVLLAFVLPRRLLRKGFVSIGTAVVLLSALWAIAAQFNDDALREMSLTMLAVWVGAYLLSIAVAWLLLDRSKRFRNVMRSLAERVSVLLYLYLPLSLLSLLIVLLRNL